MSQDAKTETKETKTEEKNAHVEEINKKLTAQEALLKTTSEQLKTLLATQSTKQTPPPKEKKSAKDYWYDDEEKAASIIKEQTKEELRAELAHEERLKERRQRDLATLYQDYPELSQSEDPLTKKAVEIFNSLTDEEKLNPLSYKAAVRDAAASLGVLPKSKRKTMEEEEFDGFNGNTNTPETKKKKRTADGELDEATLEFAKLMGQDTSDKAYLERLKKAAQRKNWTDYRQP